MPSMISGPGSDQIPGPDDQLETFATIFAAAWDPADFNTVLPLQASLIAFAANYAASLATATAPATRTSPNIATKDLRRAEIVSALRGASRSAIAAFRDGIASAFLVETLGLRVPDLVPTPILAPPDAPVLGVAGVDLGFSRLRVTQVVDGVPVSTRRYPYGLTGVEVQSQLVGGVWTPSGSFRRVNLSIDTSGMPSGVVVLFRCRYFTARGLVGPWSDSVSAVTLNG